MISVIAASSLESCRHVWPLGAFRVDRGDHRRLSRVPRVDFHHLHKIPATAAGFPFPQNVWIGTTIDKQERVASAEDAFAQLRERHPKRVLFAAIEPMLEPIKFNRLELVNRLVLGGASATQHSPAWYPPLRWIDDKRREARAAGVSLYEKSNLLVKESLNGQRYEFSDEPPAVFNHYLGKKP